MSQNPGTVILMNSQTIMWKKRKIIVCFLYFVSQMLDSV